MTKRRARSFIEVRLSQEFCPKTKVSLSSGELKGETVEVTYTEKDPVRGWTPVSFEYGHHREMIWGNRFDDLAEGLVALLGGDLSDFQASSLLSGHRECGCGHMHFVVHRGWRLSWSKKAFRTCLALHGKSDTEEQFTRRKERLAPIWDEMRKHQADCDRQDREAAEAKQPVSVTSP